MAVLRSEVERFFVEVASRIAREERDQQERDRKEATRFNVIDLIEPGENKLSDILADLIDPAGTHGQGDAFLRLLLKQLGVSASAAIRKPTTVRREALTHGSMKFTRRIDILVETQILLAIENKIDAIEQRDQIKDYVEHLEYCARGDSKRRYAVIFLTPEGRLPESLDPLTTRRLVDNGRLHCWAYSQQLRNWIAQCCAACSAKKIRYFLADLMNYIGSAINIPANER